MADNTINGAAPASNVANAPVSDSSLPPVAKAPASTVDASMMPSVPPDAGASTEPIAPGAQPPAQAEAPATDAPKDDLAKKMDAADTLALQPEQPTEPVLTPTSLPPPVEATEAVAPAPPTTGADELPKPVSVEEVRDQDLPDAKPPPPAEMAGALQNEAPEKPEKPTEDAAMAESAPTVTTGPEKTEVPEVDSAAVAKEPEEADAKTGDKRKAKGAKPSKGNDTVDEAKDTAPVEKKQKTNGAPADGGALKPGRPKKDKSAPKPAPPMGRTARKTRSQTKES
ncbi:Uu.00g013210.m01.CDS01 [Anthostomella pinea]|uniref:Uu.00g013210.m01.CDS01 n=1 Tax=Anthostomella pinea TaxID=933095 RepID=A0AAI8YMZ2_9PEZI|nr:Uu.00g013210.m01.CDS01 [Anthostomella pinea]